MQLVSGFTLAFELHADPPLQGCAQAYKPAPHPLLVHCVEDTLYKSNLDEEKETELTSILADDSFHLVRAFVKTVPPQLLFKLSPLAATVTLLPLLIDHLKLNVSAKAEVAKKASKKRLRHDEASKVLLFLNRFKADTS